MAEIKTIGLVLAKLTGVFPGTKIGADGMETYSELLQDIPDEVLVMAMRDCLLHCRFFPTIAEIRDRALPILQEYNLQRQKLLENDIYSKCPENIYRDEKNTPLCNLEQSNPGACDLSGSGRCGKWKDELFK
jgi:hypothetical protein